MTTLRSLSTEHPHVSTSSADTAALLAAVDGRGDAGHWRDAVAQTGVRRRSTVAPVERLAQLGGVGERNALYGRLAPALAERVARAALARAGVAPSEVAALLVASSTGHLVPTLDYHLSARLGVAATARHLALNDLGCVGALRAVATAAELLRGRAGAALVVAVELGSLWLPIAEPSPADLRAAMVFGDGAGAVVLDAAADSGGPQLLATQSTLWPDSLDARGAVQTGAGLRHVVSPRLPRAVVANLRRTVAEFLRGQQLALADLAFVAVNPSELDLARAIISHLDLDASAIEAPRTTWEQHGNTLAAGPLHLLRGLAERGAPGDGDLGLLLAVGPGLTCDMMLLRWHSLAISHQEANQPALH
ncbi:MAG TPA: 3-oxoacyl-[acyl-carrier-protein] synthase III C-terminal domain-containing protein [Candidatus Dormibacteraeota bacterium]|nr:3-oxoacyl-[acyl-carrier-protein] synthase III C-terminal domain-containing protein [Candidatus Dormibacteraeota bacterium]